VGGAAVPAAQDAELQRSGGITSFEIDLFGRLRNLSQAAQEQYFASSEAQRATRVTLIGEIASAWLTLASDREQLAIAQQTLKAFEQSLELTRAQFRIGTARAEVAPGGDELRIRPQRRGHRADAHRAGHQRAAVADRRASAGRAAAGDAGRRQGDDRRAAGKPSEVLLRRPDVLQAEHQLIAQNANIGAARAAFFSAPVAHRHRRLHRHGDRQAVRLGHGHLHGVADRLGEHLRLREEPGEPRLLQGRARGAVASYQNDPDRLPRVADALAQRGTIDEQVRAQTARAQAAEVAARLSDARYRAGGFLPYRAGFSAVPMPPNSSWSPGSAARATW
jgi:multidrug efflux system outer membrane protein